MNRDEIIKLAWEAGILMRSHEHQDVPTKIERFAALVAAAERDTWMERAAILIRGEREACAKVCDVLAVHPEYASDITKLAAQAIRARSNK